MVGVEDYLDMQKRYYEADASRWSLQNKDPVVGNWHLHESWPDYDDILFRNIDTQGLVALEYGCGPGRNLVRFANRFERVDGIDIAEENIKKAKLYKDSCGVAKGLLFANDGKTIDVPNDTYDVVFSVICLQHICCHEIRKSIMQEIYRVLKPGGSFCAQMGFGGRNNSVDYYANEYHATSTNGGRDVSITNEDFLKLDLIDMGFKDYNSMLRTPCSDEHAYWLWFQVKK